MKQKGKLYSFCIRENFFLMRKEYNQYCQWAAAQLPGLRWNSRVEYISYDQQQQCYQVWVTDTRSGEVESYQAHHLVLGTGPSVWIPDCALTHRQHLTHSSEYLADKTALQQKRSVTVLGSGQSAAEIYYDLLNEIDQHHYQLNWITRSPRFYPLESTKLTLEMTSPEWIDYFHALPISKRDQLNAQHQNLYKGIDSSLINDIYDLMYVKQLDGPLDVNLFTHSALQDLRWLPDGVLNSYYISRSRVIPGTVKSTSYHYQTPPFVDEIASRLRWDEKGRLDVQRSYSIDFDNRVFMQNTGIHTHGFLTPDLGMACYRNASIICSITGREVYPIEHQIAFQTFSMPQA